MSEWSAYADEFNVSLSWLNATTPAPVLKPHITTPTTGISELIVPMYVAIFLLAVVGNALVVVTLVQNKRMRTVTNVYLLNLVSFHRIFFTQTISLQLYYRTRCMAKILFCPRLQFLFWQTGKQVYTLDLVVTNSYTISTD